MDTPHPYLYGHALRAAAHAGPGVQASITFRHHGAVVRAASSDERAARCDQVEALTGDGPCVTALREGRAVVVPRVVDESRWDDWRDAAAREGFASALAMPAAVTPGMDVALNLYADAPRDWDERTLRGADADARRIAHAMSLRLHLSPDGRAEQPAQHGPQVVHQAVGAVMRCNDCSAEEALRILTDASRHRNVGLEEVAATILHALAGVAPPPERPSRSAPSVSRPVG